MLSKVEVYGFPASPLELPLESESSPVQILGVEGIGPVKANIITTPLSQSELYTGSTLPKRNIVFTFGLNPNWIDQTYEGLRTLLYEYFMPQLPVRLRFISTHMPTVDISGIVEGCEPNMFTQDPQYQVSVICPDSDFLGIVEEQATGFTGTTPTIIGYDGTRPAGFLLTVSATSSVPNYNNWFQLHTEPPGNEFIFSGWVDSARIVELSTVRGQKFVQNRTPTTGLIRSLLSTVPNGALWPVLRKGENLVSVNAASAGMSWTLKYTERFGGL